MQTLTLRKSDAGKILNAILISMAVVPPIVATAAFSLGQLSSAAAGFFAALGLIPLLLLALHMAFGPTAVCMIHTAVQATRLTALNRLPTAVRVVQTLRAQIAGAQRPLNEEELAILAENPAAHAASAYAETVRRTEEKPVRHDSGTVHIALFLLVIVSAALGFLDLSFPALWNDNGVLDGIAVLLLVVVLTLSIWAIIRQTNSDLDIRVRVLTIAVPMLYGVLFSAIMSVVFAGVGVAFGEEPDFEAFGESLDSFSWYFELIAAVMEVLIAIPGLLLVSRHRRAHRSVP